MVIEDIQYHATLFSLILTATQYQTVYEVVKPWWHKIIEFYQGNREAVMWASVGLLIHFITGALDSGYLAIAWSHWINDSNSEVTRFWFNNGSIANVFFRQLGSIAAGYFYIKAGYLVAGKPMLSVHRRLFWATLIGLIYVILLTKQVA